MSATNSLRPSRVRTIFRSRVFRVGLAAGCLVVGGECWSVHLNADPHFTIPAPPPLPVPNAYDEVVRIAARNVPPSTMLWEATTPAGSMMPQGVPGAPAPTPAPGTPPSPVQAAHHITDAERRAALARAEPALDALRAALAGHEAYHPPYYRGLTADYHGGSKFGSLAGSLIFEARMRIRDGNDFGAAESGLAAMQFGSLVQKGAGISLWLEGSSIEAQGRRPLWELVDRLDARQAADVARRVESIDSGCPPLAESITEQKWSALSEMVAVFHSNSMANLTSQINGPSYSETHGNWNIFDIFSGGDPDSQTHPESSDDRALVRRQMLSEAHDLLTRSKQDMLDDAARILDARIAQARLPFAQTHAEPPPSQDPIVRELVFDENNLYPTMFFDNADLKMEARLLSVAFALRAYRLQHNAYPATLTDLVTAGLLRAVPEDPFALTAGTPLRYRLLDPVHFLLYSVGPDGVDNGGRPATAHFDDGKPRHNPFSTDHGDWVYGVNTPQPWPVIH